MEWVNYAGFTATILKNDVSLGEFNLKGFLLTNEVLAGYQSRYNSSSSLSPWGGAYTGFSNWPDFEYAAANTSPELKSQGLLELLTNNGDTLKIYCSNVGPRYCLCLTRSDSGSNKRIKRWYIGAGTTYDYNEYSIYDGGNISLCIGFLVDGYRALPFAVVAALSSDPQYNTATFVPWQGWSKSGFESTHAYNYFFVISDAWQPPDPPGPTPSDEPYGDDTYTVSTGGDGDHDDTSDTISQDAIPIAAATRSGMCTAWVPNWGEIQDVADALLDPNIFQVLAGNVVKFSDVIIGLSIFPCAIPATNDDVVKANVLGVEIGTGVRAHIADNQFVEIPCGSLEVKEYWGNCLDYNPYTRISIFLPFCGMYELDVDEVMGKTIGVSYRIDIMSGACLATIKIDGSVFYQYSGQCSAQVPLSSVSFDQFLSSMIELGVATATGVGAVGAAGGAVSAVRDQMFVPKSREDLKAHTAEIASAEQNYSKVKEQSANSIADAAVGAVMGSKGFYQHAGAMSGSPGFLGIKTPYLIIKRPEQLIPGMYGKFHGFPSNTTAVLGDLVGYTEIGDIRLNIPEATVDEIIECEQLLKGGVVI